MKYNPIEKLAKGLEFAPATTEGKNGVSVEVFSMKVGEREVVMSGRDAEVANRIQFFQEVGAQSGKALAVYLGYFNEEKASFYGFKGVNPLLREVASKLDSNTISKYRKVGILFGQITKDGAPAWKKDIPQGVSVTNLTSVLGLASQGKKLEDLSEDEVKQLYKEFVDEYLDPVSPKLHLQATLSVLRKEVQDIQTTIGGSATKKKSSGKKKDEGGKDSTEDLAPVEKAKLALSTLYAFFEGNAEVLEALALVQASIPEDTEEETEEETEDTEEALSETPEA